MWVDAYDKVEIETWNNDLVDFICPCGKELQVFTGDGDVECACGRSYKQYTSFKVNDPGPQEREIVLIRMKAVQAAFNETVDAFVAATKELERMIEESREIERGRNQDRDVAGETEASF